MDEQFTSNALRAGLYINWHLLPVVIIRLIITVSDGADWVSQGIPNPLSWEPEEMDTGVMVSSLASESEETSVGSYDLTAV